NSAFCSWRSFTCYLNAATLRATPHLCISEFSSQRDAFRGTYVALLWKAARKKARMQTHTGLSKQAVKQG
ncbi:hypothetical protein, partial [Escherichia coli]